MANAILTITYIQSTFITDQNKCIENFQNDKQIRELLDMPKRPQAPKHILWGSKNSKSSKSGCFDYVRNEAMLVIVFLILSKTCYMRFFMDV